MFDNRTRRSSCYIQRVLCRGRCIVIKIVNILWIRRIVRRPPAEHYKRRADRVMFIITWYLVVTRSRARVCVRQPVRGTRDLINHRKLKDFGRTHLGQRKCTFRVETRGLHDYFKVRTRYGRRVVGNLCGREANRLTVLIKTLNGHDIQIVLLFNVSFEYLAVCVFFFFSYKYLFYYALKIFTKKKKCFFSQLYYCMRDRKLHFGNFFALIFEIEYHDGFLV